MFKCAYNIDFEIIAFLFTILLYMEMRRSFPIQTRKNKEFRIMTVMVLATEAFDLISAVTNGYGTMIPKALNIFVNSGYFMSGLFLCYMFHDYIEESAVGVALKSKLLIFNRFVLLASEISVALNSIFGYFFFFSSEGTYERGPLYLVMHIVSLWFVLCASTALMIYRKHIETSRMVSSAMFIALYFLAVYFQTFIFTKVLIIMPAVSAMLIVTIFSLESPDYLKLQDTLKELMETKKQLEAANKKYYNMAYTDLMTGLKNRAAYNVRLEQLEMSQNNETLIFMIADVNGLKELNDKLGHLVGDDAIKKTGRLLQKNFTKGCQCYRIGGDEFAVIGHEISFESFEKKYLNFLEDIRLEGKKSTYKYSVATGYQITDDRKILDALKKADEKMYQNKSIMKNTTDRRTVQSC